MFTSAFISCFWPGRDGFVANARWFFVTPVPLKITWTSVPSPSPNDGRPTLIMRGPGGHPMILLVVLKLQSTKIPMLKNSTICHHMLPFSRQEYGFPGHLSQNSNRSSAFGNSFVCLARQVSLGQSGNEKMILIETSCSETSDIGKRNQHMLHVQLFNHNLLVQQLCFLWIGTCSKCQALLAIWWMSWNNWPSWARCLPQDDDGMTAGWFE